LPESIAIVGGGYIAAEFGHFFASMGSKVTIIGRNPQFVPEEEPEVSELAKKVLGRHINIITNHEVKEVKEISSGLKELVALDRKTGKTVTVTAREIMIASGRGPITDILHPEKSGIQRPMDGLRPTNIWRRLSRVYGRLEMRMASISSNMLLTTSRQSSTTTRY
jgi:dihydrolipoamide dehydrogenase